MKNLINHLKESLRIGINDEPKLANQFDGVSVDEVLQYIEVLESTSGYKVDIYKAADFLSNFRNRTFINVNNGNINGEGYRCFSEDWLFDNKKKDILKNVQNPSTSEFFNEIMNKFEKNVDNTECITSDEEGYATVNYFRINNEEYLMFYYDANDGWLEFFAIE